MMVVGLVSLLLILSRNFLAEHNCLIPRYFCHKLLKYFFLLMEIKNLV